MLVILLLSIFSNLLALTGPLYMMQVYDRVLGSRSVETLIALTLIMLFLYAMMGLFDICRSYIMTRIAAQFQTSFDRRVFRATLNKTKLVGPDSYYDAARAPSDIENVQRLISSPAFLALFDLPWTPIFIFGIFMFHPWLGYLSAGGALVLILVTLLNQAIARNTLVESLKAQRKAQMKMDNVVENADLVRGLGMGSNIFSRWLSDRGTALSEQIRSSSVTQIFSTVSKVLRMALQSMILGLGAYLVLRQEATPGVMIAASIITTRALAPVDQIIGQWPAVQTGLVSWKNIRELLAQVPEAAPRTALPRPKGDVEVSGLAVRPPGADAVSLQGISFKLPAGRTLGIIGPSGAGKSTLVHALAGIWPAIGGQIRLGGATIDQYDPDIFGSLIGYLPQNVELFDGTIGENIARMAENPNDADIIAAAKAAAAHEMIIKLPKGYDTPLGADQAQLSGGQIQRIGLARALYGDPVVLLLDEPNSNLDQTGTAALNHAVRGVKARGGSVIVVAHRPSAIREAELLLYIENGRPVAFGKSEEVLRRFVSNHESIARDIKAAPSATPAAPAAPATSVVQTATATITPATKTRS
ncbi:type I secretion system permease/ATPase [Paracoccus sp. SCSIO 75233]|uniref:type I secretion system permease/ATPase n=1 Tax=Paracoccus sp. SCSIO 75233 TaxID=3017782 RepID=UPI0022F04FF7|nr:type I secretion system permease/ATPase [Paracoccus sp. SCSIO 75233]WBU55368.1 type I secretion system permease/ATPase [Paracoccus sp. SCSIO 75233]